MKKEDLNIMANMKMIEELKANLLCIIGELYSLLVKAVEIGDLEPAPKGASYTANPGETKVNSEYVRNFINTKSATIPDEDVSGN